MTETFDPQVITVSPEACEHFAHIVKRSKARAVRLCLRPAGCAGFQYDWQVVYSEYDHTEIVADHGSWKLIMDDQTRELLAGSEIVLKRHMINTQIEVLSPNATSSCGCGESVSFEL